MGAVLLTDLVEWRCLQLEHVEAIWRVLSCYWAWRWRQVHPPVWQVQLQRLGSDDALINGITIRIGMGEGEQMLERAGQVRRELLLLPYYRRSTLVAVSSYQCQMWSACKAVIAPTSSTQGIVALGILIPGRGSRVARGVGTSQIWCLNADDYR